METQKRNALDKITIKKIGKGAMIAGISASLIFVLTYLKTYNFGNATLNGLAVELIPTLINAIREFRKGEIGE